MKKTTFIIAFIFALWALASVPAAAQTKYAIPDVDGYKVLKCDFHIHTVFSDGSVWPNIRIDEAVREGLDAISITDHIEYRPHHTNGDMTSDYNRSYEIAAPYAEQRGVILLRGSEISRGMPPGHSNAIFLKDSNPLAVDAWRDAYAEAKRQGAFIFWNHPNWQRQQPDETLWWPEHTELYKGGMMYGIEIVNGINIGYSPEAHQWCIDKKLTMIGNTDSHGLNLFPEGQHRVMTLVLAAERSPEAIHEALKARRTVVFYDKLLIGETEWLKPLFESCVEITNVTRGPRRITVEFQNNSDLTFELRKTAHDPSIDYMPTGSMTIKPQQKGSFVVRFPEGTGGNVNFEVTNLLVGPERGLEMSYGF